MTPREYLTDLCEKNGLNLRKLSEQGPAGQALSVWQVGPATIVVQDFGENGFSVYTPTPNNYKGTDEAILKSAGIEAGESA